MKSFLLQASPKALNVGQLGFGGLMAEMSDNAAPVVASVLCFVLTEIIKQIKQRYQLKQIDKNKEAFKQITDSSVMIAHLSKLLKKRK
jgi:hypothetical protein